MDDDLEPTFIPLTLRQALALQELLPDGTPIHELSRYEAAGLIALYSPGATWRSKPPTTRQEEFLRRHGRSLEGLTRGGASDLIAEIMGVPKVDPASRRSKLYEAKPSQR